MNEATQKMADYALAQTILIAIGTGLLFYTLWLTRQANRAAVKAAVAAESAVEVTRKIGEAQVRAYLSVHRIQFNLSPSDNEAFARIEVMNAGQSPAIDVRIDLSFQIAFGAPGMYKIRKIYKVGNVAPGEKVRETIALILADLGESVESLKNKELIVVVDGEVIFEDVFEITRTIQIPGTALRRIGSYFAEWESLYEFKGSLTTRLDGRHWDG